MGRKVNLKIQMHKQINNLIAIGTSRHEMKKLTGNNSSPFIHSASTADAYRQTVNEFSSWLKNEKSDIWDTKDLSAISKDIAYEYLQERESKGLSAWTITKDLSAINKVLDLGLNKREGNLSERRLQDITRSREVKEHDFKYNQTNYSQQIDIARAFGLRRESITGGNYAVKESSFFIKNNNLYVSVIEKGGRYREAQCLESYKNDIVSRYDVEFRDSFTKNEFIEHYVDDKNNALFDSYTAKIDNHAFRSEYATNLYKELASQKENLLNDYKGYDSELLKEVSENLGHSRLSVVVSHYLK